MAAVVAGHSDLRLRSEQRPRLPNIAVLLAKVNAVGAKALGQLHAVVDDEGNARIGADALQRLGQPRKLMFGHVFHAQLEGSDDFVPDSRLQPVRKAPANLLRGNEVEPAGLRPLGRWKL